MLAMVVFFCWKFGGNICEQFNWPWWGAGESLNSEERQRSLKFLVEYSQELIFKCFFQLQ
jgi:hypothetical protein